MAIVRSGLLVLVGIALVGIWFGSAAANFAHGTQLAGHSPYWWVYGSVSAFADIIKAAALIGLVAAWRRVHVIAILACCLVWLVTTGWGIRSCLGFVATTLSDTISERGMHKVSDTSIAKQIEQQCGLVVSLQQDRLKASPSSWDRFQRAIDDADKRCNSMGDRARKTQTVGAADPVGALLARYGIDEKTTESATAFLFLVMVEICASMGLVAFSPLFAGEGGEGVREAAEAVAAPLMGALTPPPTPQGGGKPRRAPPASSPLRAQTKALLGQLEDKHGEGATILTGHVFAAYLALAGASKWNPKMTSVKLGRQLALLGVTRTDMDEQKRIFYVLPTARERKPERWEGERPPAA